MNQLAERWQRISPRERKMVVILGCLGFAFFGYQVLYKGQITKIGKARKEWMSLRQQVASARSAQPEIFDEEKALEEQNQTLEKIRKKVNQGEEKLFALDDLGRLVGDLARQAEGLQLSLESIKQEIKTDPEGTKVALEIICKAPYEDLVNFLRRIELRSPFLRVAQLKATQPKEAQKGWTENRLLLITPVRMTAPSGDEKKALPEKPQPPPEKITLARSPFGAKQSQQPVTNEAVSKLKLMGITWRGPDSTAIINNDVVKIGDKVGAFVVQQILPTMVIVTDGTDSLAINLENQQSNEKKS